MDASKDIIIKNRMMCDLGIAPISLASTTSAQSTVLVLGKRLKRQINVT